MEQDDGQLRSDAPESPGHENCHEEESDDLSNDCAFVTAGELVVRDMPELKVLGYLQNGTATLDIGKTIKDLFVSMENMNAHLNSVLSINAVLEKDIKASKDVMARLKEEKSQLEEAITIMKEENPSKRELTAEIDLLIEERNEAQASIRSMKQLVEKTVGEAQELKDRIVELQNEKVDLTKDIDYINLKFDAAVNKLNAYAKEITILKGEKLSNHEKIENLRQQYGKCIEEKKTLLLKHATIIGE